MKSYSILNLQEFYFYIAIFTFEDDGIHVTFPDLAGCVTFGKDEREAYLMAQEALKLHLYGMEEDNLEIPAATSIKYLVLRENLAPNEIFTMINVSMSKFRNEQNKKFSSELSITI